MSSFLCFVCHSTVNADTNEDTREKYREVIGMNLCPDSHLCFICCHFLNKMCLFKSICVKRSLEYPVLFSEKGTINLQKSDTQVAILCPEDICIQHINSSFHFGNTNDNSQSDSEEKYVQLHRDQKANSHNEIEHYSTEYLININNDNLFNDSLQINELKHAVCDSFGDNSHRFGDGNQKYGGNNNKLSENCYKFNESGHNFNENNLKYGESHTFSGASHKCGEIRHNFRENRHKYVENSYKFSDHNQCFNYNSHHMTNDSHNFDHNSNNFTDPSHSFGKNSHKYTESSRNYGDISHKFTASSNFGEANRNFGEITHKLIETSRHFGEASRKLGENSHKTNETSHTDASSQTYDITAHITVRENELFCKTPKIEPVTEKQHENNEIDENNEANIKKDDDVYDEESQNSGVSQKSDNSEIDDNAIDINENSDIESKSHGDNESMVNSAMDKEIETAEDLNTDNNSIEETITETDKVDRKTKKKEFKRIVLSTEEQKRELQANRQSKKYLEAVFKCNSCAMGFLLKDSYQAHMMRHEESNGEHRCNICKLRFANPAVLRSHLANHAERYRCRYCGDLVRARQRQTHLVACRGSETEGIACHLCGNTFQGASHFQQHLKRFHQSKTSSRTLSCNVCGKTYNNQAALRTHMITHINRKFTCETCNTAFSSPYTLNQHKKTHNSEPSELHYCIACKTSYKTRKSLLSHWRTAVAHKETVYKCSTCGKTCPSLRSLHSHISNVHSRSKHLSCDVCLVARYSTRKALVRHMLTHKLQEPQQTPLCHACGEHFKSTSKLKRHLKTVCEKNKQDEDAPNFYQ